MRAIVLSLSVLCLFGCGTDALVPCSGEASEGKICREYRYLNGISVGFVSYLHGGDSLIQSEYFGSSSNLEKTIIQRFENGMITVYAEQYSNSESKVRTYHYNEQDSLTTIYYGASDSLTEVSYENGKRKLVSYFRSGELIRYDEYRYFLDDGDLYRIYQFNASDSLLSYQSFEYFSSGHIREAFYTGSNDFVGRKVYLFETNGLISSVEFTGPNGQVSDRSQYIYDGDLKLIEYTRTTDSREFKSIFLYH